METKLFTEQELLGSWLAIGNRNHWVKYSNDPPFTLKSFSKCETIEELEENISQGNWCLGQAFYYKNLCFINQVDGGDEWLTIKDDLSFESMTFSGIIKDGEFYDLINRLLTASLIDCKNLDY